MWRQARLFTQEELAAQSGVSVATIGRIEKGGPARISTVRKLLQALNMDVTVLEGLLHGDRGAFEQSSSA